MPACWHASVVLYDGVRFSANLGLTGFEDRNMLAGRTDNMDFLYRILALPSVPPLAVVFFCAQWAFLGLLMAL